MIGSVHRWDSIEDAMLLTDAPLSFAGWQFKINHDGGLLEIIMFTVINPSVHHVDQRSTYFFFYLSSRTMAPSYLHQSKIGHDGAVGQSPMAPS